MSGARHGTSLVRFLLIALTGPVLAGLASRAVTGSVSPLVSTLVIALAMPAPLLAAVVEDGWRALVADLTSSFDRPRRLVLLPLAAFATWYGAALALATIAAEWGIGGGLVATTEELRTAIGTQLPAGTDPGEVPAPRVLAVVGAVAGAFAGVTLNGLLAFGEEYGWRGHLWTRLQHRGRVATIGAVGVCWGLWHAPLIALVGLNYPASRPSGIGVMVLFTVAASWPLDELRRLTDGALAPAILHGMINGAAGVLVLLSASDPRVGLPAGVMGAIAMLPAGALLAWFRRRSAAPDGTQRRRRRAVSPHQRG